MIEQTFPISVRATYRDAVDGRYWLVTDTDVVTECTESVHMYLFRYDLGNVHLQGACKVNALGKIRFIHVRHAFSVMNQAC